MTEKLLRIPGSKAPVKEKADPACPTRSCRRCKARKSMNAGWRKSPIGPGFICGDCATAIKLPKPEQKK